MQGDMYHILLHLQVALLQMGCTAEARVTGHLLQRSSRWCDAGSN